MADKSGIMKNAKKADIWISGDQIIQLNLYSYIWINAHLNND